MFRTPEPRQELRHGPLDAGLVVGLDVQRAEGWRALVTAEPIGKGIQRRDHKDVHGRETEPLVQAARVAVPDQHLEADVREAGGASRVEDACEQRPPDPLVACVGPHVDVGDMRRPPAAIPEGAEDEPEGATFLLCDQRHTLAHGLGEVGPGVVPALPEVVGLGKLGLELGPQLVDEVLVVLGGGTDVHR